MRDSVNVNFV